MQMQMASSSDTEVIPSPAGGEGSEALPPDTRQVATKSGNRGVLKMARNEFEVLFELGQREALTRIFLLLDLRSLHAARQVNTVWNSFIREDIWRSRMCRRVLERKLTLSWRIGKVEKTRSKPDKFFTSVDSVACDTDYIYCSNSTPLMRIYSRATAHLLAKLDMSLIGTRNDNRTVANIQVGTSIFGVQVPVEMADSTKFHFYIFSKCEFVFLKRIFVKAEDLNFSACLSGDKVFSFTSSQCETSAATTVDVWNFQESQAREKLQLPFSVQELTASGDSIAIIKKPDCLEDFRQTLTVWSLSQSDVRFEADTQSLGSVRVILDFRDPLIAFHSCGGHGLTVIELTTRRQVNFHHLNCLDATLFSDFLAVTPLEIDRYDVRLYNVKEALEGRGGSEAARVFNNVGFLCFDKYGYVSVDPFKRMLVINRILR